MQYGGGGGIGRLKNLARVDVGRECGELRLHHHFGTCDKRKMG